MQLNESEIMPTCMNVQDWFREDFQMLLLVDNETSCSNAWQTFTCHLFVTTTVSSCCLDSTLHSAEQNEMLQKCLWFFTSEYNLIIILNLKRALQRSTSFLILWFDLEVIWRVFSCYCLHHFCNELHSVYNLYILHNFHNLSMSSK